MKQRRHRSPFPTLIALTAAALLVALAVPTTAAPASSTPSVVDEIARIRGLSTFAKLLEETGVARMVDSLATPVDSADNWFALFAFSDEAWERLGVIDNGSGMDRLGADRTQLGELVRRHVVGINPGRVVDGEEIPFSRLQAAEVVRSLLEQGSVRTLDEGFLPIRERARDAARVTDAYRLDDSAIVVFTVDQVLFPSETYSKYFPSETYAAAPVAESVAFASKELDF